MIHLSIRQKLRAALGLMAVLICIVSAVAIYGLRDEHAMFSGFVSNATSRLALANELMHASNARAIAARNMVLTDSQQSLAKERERAVAAHQTVQRVHEGLRAKVSQDQDVTEAERAAYKRLVDIEASYAPVALRVVDKAFKGERASAIDEMNINCHPLLDELVEASSAYIAQSDAQAKAVVSHADRMASAQQMALLIVAALAILAATVLAWALPSSILEPISMAVRAAETVAQGNLTQHIDVSRHDEAGQLLKSLQAMNASLAGIVQRVRDASDSIAIGSTEIAQGNQDLSTRTELQASSLEQTSATMGEMMQAVRGSAHAAEEANHIAAEASQAARRGGEVVDQVVATMGDITASSKKISEIIGTIDGIAFQTNILALNAAVEAARAGEQGRGFAVVAGEVRGLAQRSAEAAREIRQLITASVERVEAGSKLVADAGGSIHGVVEQVERVAAMMQEINEAASRQNDGFSRINMSVTSLDQATQQNASLVQQSAAAAESLRKQAGDLKNAVAAFSV